jgi:hypothetical protein
MPKAFIDFDDVKEKQAVIESEYFEEIFQEAMPIEESL